MRNLAEQKRVFNAVLFSNFTAFFGLIFIVLFFLFHLFPVASLMGFNILPYSSASAGAFKKGDLVLYLATPPEETEGKLFSYYTEGLNAKGKPIKIKHTMFYAGSYEQDVSEEVNGESVTVTKTIHMVKNSPDGTVSYLNEDDIFGEGWSAFRVAYIGYGAIYLNYTIYVSIFALIAFIIILTLPSTAFVLHRAAYATDLGFWKLSLMLPIVGVFIALSLRKRYNVLATPFPEGIDPRDLNRENYYIITELRHFFKKGKFLFVKGHDCYKVYIPSNSKRILFATVLQINKHIQVLIHTDLKRPDGRIDRSNFINIYNAVELPDIKKEIVRIFRTYFKPRLPKSYY